MTTRLTFMLGMWAGVMLCIGIHVVRDFYVRMVNKADRARRANEAPKPRKPGQSPGSEAVR